MATREGTDQDWIQEFRQLNQAASPRPSDVPPQGSERDPRRRHDRFELGDSEVAIFHGGLLASVGIGRENLARRPLDLSEGGARVLLDRRLRPGTKVKVRIELEKFGDTLEASGVVRWCYESGTKRGDFFRGVMFTDLNASQKKKIAFMREWFTSAKFKAMRMTRRREADTPFHMTFSK